MKGISKISAVSFGLSLMLAVPWSYAAEVYYLGGNQGGNGDAKNASFTVQDRVKDLFDFGSYGEYGPDRSGRISGTISQEFNANNVYGNKDKSFLKEGGFSVTELNLNIQEKLWDDYSFEGQTFFRKTDDHRIESRKDVRLKQLDLRVFNKDNMVQFGDFYGDFSQFVLGQSLEGLNVKIAHEKGQTYRFVAGRKSQADPSSNMYQRNVVGGMAEYVFRNNYGFPFFSLGVQAVTSQDDKGSIDQDTSAIDMNNTVGSIDGEMSPVKDFKVAYEVAQSAYRYNERDPLCDTQYGSAFRLQPELKIKDARVKYLYYYVTPKFYTDAGSAMPDKEQHQVSFDWKILPGLSISLVQNYYWDHLPGSKQAKRTTNDEKYMSAHIRPLKGKPEFSIRPYVNLLNRDSDDRYNTLESQTNTFGFAVNDTLDGGKMNYGFGYEYREYLDIANNGSGTELFNRILVNFGVEFKLFGRRLYVSDDISTDFRSVKTDSNPDVTFNNAFSVNYDISDRCVFRASNNVHEFDGSGPASNLTNTRNYAELVFTIDKKRATRLTFRFEDNMYRHEDGTQSYTEDRYIIKIATNF